MLGHWLDGLSPDAKGRLLTTPFGPMPSCVVQVADDAPDNWQSMERVPATSYRWRKRPTMERPRAHAPVIWGQYDQLCHRFGMDRINRMIRDRLGH